MKKNKSLLFFMLSLTWAILIMTMVMPASEIHVTTTQDNVNGSLRAAITTANTNSERDTIYLPAGTYLLTGSPGEDANAGGDLDFNSLHKINIIGEGRSLTTIDGNKVDRVLHILKGNVSITGVTIRGGKTPDAPYLENSESGGGIKNNGTLELSHCTISNNTTGNGGGCHPGMGVETGGAGGSGGGIINSGTLNLTRCTITYNSTGRGGGGGINKTGGISGAGAGICNSAGTITLTGCTISYNSAGFGGEACNGGLGGSGGGIYNPGYCEINCYQCTINDNSAGFGGEAGCVGGYCGNGGHGGGIFNGGLFRLTNCTISNNRTGTGGIGDGTYGYSGSGGGIYTDSDERICQTYLTNCTIVYNSIGEYEEIWTGEGYGGGLYTGGGVVDLIATIVAYNRLSQSGGCGPDGYGIFNTRGYNLVKDMSCVDFYSGQPGEIFNKDPLLGPLTDNGGPTRTHALLSGSPAIDAGKATGLTIDQRGYTRPVDIPGISNVADGSDIGAYEYVPTFMISGKITYWDSTTAMEGVNLTFSNNGGDTSTDKFGVYSHSVPQGWSGTVTPSKQGYKFTPVSRTYSSIQSDRLNQNYSAQPLILPTISLNRTHLNFGFVKDGNQSGSQAFSISNSGGGMLNWSLDDDADWLVCNPTNGLDKGTVTVTVEIGGLAAGTYSGSVTISAPNAANSPQKVNVTLVIYENNTTGGPFGYFETPTDGATVYGSIPVTGWALDDIGVESVKIYRALNEQFVYIGDAVFIEGARPDVELTYPNYPNNYKAGWGYMLLTNVLPNNGNGTFTLHALAWDKEGHQVDLGWKTITVDNAHAVKPFGAIDTPTQGGKAAGTSYRNAGWVLTPQPNKIPEDGHTISVWIDGKKIGNPFYNIYRQDVAALFPGYANSNGAHAYLNFDTTTYENGMHTIMWIAEDNAGNSEGIGSRYFTIENSSGDKNPDNKPGFPSLSMSMSGVDTIKTIEMQKGFQADSMQTLYIPGSGDRVIEITELMPLEIRLDAGKARPGIKETLEIKKEEKWGAFLKVGESLRKLPIGSSFDSDKGIFYWNPGPGFLGAYPLIFIKKDKNGILKKCELTIKVIPKF